VRRPLVPDVAYISHDRLRPLSDEELQVPRLAPDVGAEILSWTIGDPTWTIRFVRACKPDHRS
jgi:hypothetical protein